ncbi:MAG: transposase family protein [Gemmatimonadetes bacterium]|nr:transposase family protein [Gemmatimonadota bacterium]
MDVETLADANVVVDQLRHRTITRPNEVWAMDITYIPMAHGFVYLAAVLDWVSRRVLSWSGSITSDSAFCIAAVEEALAHYGRPAIFNTDQGALFTSAAFTALLQAHGIQISMDGKARQHLRRTSVALAHVRSGLSPRVRIDVRRHGRHRPLLHPLQQPATALEPRRPHPDDAYFAPLTLSAAACPSPAINLTTTVRLNRTTDPLLRSE